MRFFFSILFFFTFWFASAQRLDQLQLELENSQFEIDRITNLLSNNRQKQLSSDQRINLLEKRLNIRQKLLKETNLRISQLESALNSLDSKVFLCEKKIDSLKNFFTDLVFLCDFDSYSYHSTLDNSCDFICLSAIKENLSSSIYSIDSLIRLTGFSRNQINSQKRELEKLQNKRNNEIINIVSETANLSSLKKELKSSESVMLSEIESLRSKINNLQKKIEKFISEDNSVPSQVNSSLSSNFASNKGKLPSPLPVKSKIIDRYGVYNHPTLKGVKVSNTGVNLSVTNPTNVVSVFNGEVRGIYSVEGTGKTVLIRHGKYFTVYSNLSSVRVSNGSSVSTGQVIGSISSAISNVLFLHFEVWEGTKTLDPLLWIKY